MGKSVILTFEYGCIAGLLVAMFVLARQDVRGKRFMLAALAGSLLQNLGYLLELNAPAVETALTAVKIEYTGSMFVPLLYSVFIYHYCDPQPKAWMRKAFLALAGLDLVLLAVVFTSGHHTLFYREVAFLASEPEGFYYLDLTYGPLYYVCLLVQSIAPFLLAVTLLVRAFLTPECGVPAGRNLLFLLVSALPVAALLIYRSKVSFMFDSTPAVLSLSLSLVSVMA